jgi:PadR family transcriptional regulator, regulatory protein PadR
MKISSTLGNFEEITLLAIIKIGENAYGAPIRQLMEEVMGRSVSAGALYTTLDRLMQKGYISSRQGERTPERGGKAKRYYKVEGAGIAALDDARRIRSEIQTNGGNGGGILWNRGDEGEP